MNKTLIPWVKNPDGSQGYTWNPITGCLNRTPEGLCLGGNFPCYAYRLAHGRLRSRYLANSILPAHDEPDHQAHHNDPFYPRLWVERFDLVSLVKTKPRGVFVCDMSDLFGIGVPEEWTTKVLINIKHFSQHRFYLLTKQPQNLIKFSPFPDNCWVGVSATDDVMFRIAWNQLGQVEAKVKYISFEPLLNWDMNYFQSFPVWIEDVDWVIIGALTCKASDILHRGDKYPGLTAMPWGGKWTLQPKIAWVEEIVRACDKAGVKVFLKDNLKPLLDMDLASTRSYYRLFSDDLFHLRQELPTTNV